MKRRALAKKKGSRARLPDVDIVPFHLERHLDSSVRFWALNTLSLEITLRNEIRKLYSRLPDGMYVAVRRDDSRPVALLSVGYLEPRPVRYAIGVFGSFFPSLVDPLVLLLTKLKIISKFEIANVIVDEKFKGQGLGTRLMDLGEEFIHTHYGQSKAYLYVHEDNAPAVKFYRDRGYRDVSFFYLAGRKKFVMVKNLN